LKPRLFDRSVQSNRPARIFNHNHFKSFMARIHRRKPHAVVVRKASQKNALNLALAKIPCEARLRDAIIFSKG